MIRLEKNTTIDVRHIAEITCDKFELSVIQKMLSQAQCVKVNMNQDFFYCFSEFAPDYINIEFALSQFKSLESLLLKYFWKNKIEKVTFLGCNDWVLQLYPLLLEEGILVEVKGEIWRIIHGENDLFCTESYTDYKELSVNTQAQKKGLYNEFVFVIEILQFNRWKIMNDVRKFLKQIGANVFTSTIPEFEDLERKSEEECYRNERQMTITNGRLNMNSEDVISNFEKIYGENWRDIRRRCATEAMAHWLCAIYDVEYYLRNKKSYSYEKNRCYLIGPCIVEGSTCPEDGSFPEKLQKYLNENFLERYSVIAITIPFYVINNYLEVVKSLAIRTNDIVLCVEPVSKKCISCYCENCGIVPDIDQLEIFNTRNEGEIWFADAPGHTSAFANQKLAEYIGRYIRNNINTKRVNTLLQKGTCSLHNEKIEMINKYLQSMDKFQDDDMEKRTGAIIVKYDSASFRHEYLIDYARKKVDYLYVFLIKGEEEKLFFEESLQSVKQYVKDWNNIIVTSSDRFAGSNIDIADSSPQKIPSYLRRKLKKEGEVDAWQNMEIFAQYVAPQFKISLLFVEEEDKAEKDFSGINNEVERILNDYGMNLIEIPQITG